MALFFLFLLVILRVAIACVNVPGFVTLSIEARVELGLNGLAAAQKPTAVPAEVWLFKNLPKSLKAPLGTSPWSGWELSRQVPAEGAAAPPAPGCGIWG